MPSSTYCFFIHLQDGPSRLLPLSPTPAYGKGKKHRAHRTIPFRGTSRQWYKTLVFVGLWPRLCYMTALGFKGGWEMSYWATVCKIITQEFCYVKMLKRISVANKSLHLFSALYYIKPIIFNVIMGRVWFKSTILVFVFYLSHLFLVLFSSFSTSFRSVLFYDSLFFLFPLISYKS